jgi:hypothetical protein
MRQDGGWALLYLPICYETRRWLDIGVNVICRMVARHYYCMPCDKLLYEKGWWLGTAVLCDLLWDRMVARHCCYL